MHAAADELRHIYPGSNIDEYYEVHAFDVGKIS